MVMILVELLMTFGKKEMAIYYRMPATSRNNFDWSETFKKYEYASLQKTIGMYQWLFKKNGFQVAEEAYLLYLMVGKMKSFLIKLKFDVHFIKLSALHHGWNRKLLIL